MNASPVPSGGLGLRLRGVPCAHAGASEAAPTGLEAVTLGAAWGMVVCLVLSLTGVLPAASILKVSGPLFLALVSFELLP